MLHNDYLTNDHKAPNWFLKELKRIDRNLDCLWNNKRKLFEIYEYVPEKRYMGMFNGGGLYVLTKVPTYVTTINRTHINLDSSALNWIKFNDRTRSGFVEDMRKTLVKPEEERERDSKRRLHDLIDKFADFSSFYKCGMLHSDTTLKEYF